MIEIVLGGTAGCETFVSVACIFSTTARIALLRSLSNLGQVPASLNPLELNNFVCLQNLQFGTSHNQNETAFRRATATTVRSGPVTGSTTTAMTRSPSARSSETTLVGSQPKSLELFQNRSSTRSPQWFAMPTVGRKEAHDYLKQFVLEQMRVPDLPHYPMNDLRKMTPPPLPPTSGG
jgi:hypothetical protein